MKPPASWMIAANELAAILEAENNALRASNFAAAIALLPAKRAAVETLESLTPDSPKAALREAVTRLDRLAAENRDLLKRSIGIQSQVLGIIAGAARVAFAFGYGKSGQSNSRGGAFTLSSKA
jgi:flagellar biosynthesis/type III secretory pathway chaperone